MKAYMSVPIGMLDAAQSKRLYAEMAGLLAEHGFEAVSNPAALQDASEEERLWKYLACGMLLLKDCEAVLLPPVYLDLRSGPCAVEFRAALYKKRIMYSYRDADRKLRLTPDSLAERGMKYPER